MFKKEELEHTIVKCKHPINHVVRDRGVLGFPLHWHGANNCGKLAHSQMLYFSSCLSYECRVRDARVGDFGIECFEWNVHTGANRRHTATTCHHFIAVTVSVAVL
ncbi:hypothetical protein DINM_000170 [Dirofilaria immitis]|nr:hypothetical protein [Dirofilaria immitis]